MTLDKPPPSVIPIAIIDENAFFATAAASWLINHDPRIRITTIASHWESISVDQFARTKILILDADAADGPPLAAKAAILRSARITAIFLGTRGTREGLRAIEDAGGRFLLRTEPTPVLLDTIQDVHLDPHRSAPISQSGSARTHSGALPALAPREQQVLVLYASGRTVNEVAEMMSLSHHSVVSYIKVIRKKYSDAGLPAGTKTALHQRATSAGLL